MTAFRTLLYKESLRFWKVSFQTVKTPVLTSVMYLGDDFFAGAGRSRPGV